MPLAQLIDDEAPQDIFSHLCLMLGTDDPAALMTLASASTVLNQRTNEWLTSTNDLPTLVETAIEDDDKPGARVLLRRQAWSRAP